MTPERCGNCRFARIDWLDQGDGEKGSAFVFCCRRAPLPRRYTHDLIERDYGERAEDKNANVVWPLVNADEDWCGEWEEGPELIPPGVEEPE